MEGLIEEVVIIHALVTLAIENTMIRTSDLRVNGMMINITIVRNPVTINVNWANLMFSYRLKWEKLYFNNGWYVETMRGWRPTEQILR